jgi:hypothetical protein
MMQPPKAPEKILGKFASQDDLVKAYQAAESELGKLKRDGAPTAAEPPESYDLTGVWEKLGVAKDQLQTPALQEEMKHLNQKLREHKFTQQQAPAVIELAQEIARSTIGIDSEAEKAALVQEWGAEAQSKYQTIHKWAHSNLPARVATQLTSTADGSKIVQKLMDASAAKPTALNQLTAPSQQAMTGADIRKRMGELVADRKLYKTPEGQQEFSRLNRELIRMGETLSTAKRG